MKVLKWLVIIFSVAMLGLFLVGVIPNAGAKITQWLGWDATKFARTFEVVRMSVFAGTFMLIGVASIGVPIIGIPLILVGVIQAYLLIKSFAANGTTQ